MAYIEGNPRSFAELKRRIAAGESLRVLSSGNGKPVEDGVTYIEGPHFPEPVRWATYGAVKDGILVKLNPAELT